MCFATKVQKFKADLCKQLTQKNKKRNYILIPNKCYSSAIIQYTIVSLVASIPWVNFSFLNIQRGPYFDHLGVAPPGLNEYYSLCGKAQTKVYFFINLEFLSQSIWALVAALFSCSQRASSPSENKKGKNTDT